MKKRSISVFVALMLSISSVTLFSQTAIPDSLLPKPSAEVDYAKSIISRLCSPEFAGRSYARGADKMVANYIADELASIGISPVGGTYLQPFPVNANTFPGAMSLTLGQENLAAGKDFVVDAGSAGATGTFKLIYVDRKGVADNLVLLDKIRDAVNGNGFLLIDNRPNPDETPEQTKRINGQINNVKSESKINLKGVLIYQPGMKLNWATAPVQNPRAAVYICKEIEDISKVKDVKIAVDAVFNTAYETQNVVGMMKGGLKPDSFIVIACNYDHLGLMGKDVYFPGANYGASGVAMMLSLAKHYQLIMPNVSVLFVAFGGSELGNAGARAFMKNPPVALNKIKLFVGINNAGYGSEGVALANVPKFEKYLKEMQKISVRYKLLPKIEGMPLHQSMGSAFLFDANNTPSIFTFSISKTAPQRNLEDTADALPLTRFAEYLNLMIRLLETVR